MVPHFNAHTLPGSSRSFHHSIRGATKGEARSVVGKLAGLWRPTNLYLAKRMPELYPKTGKLRHLAHV